MLAQPGGRVPACSMPELSAVYRVLSSLRMACATDHCIRTTSAFRHQRHVLCVSWALQLAYHQQEFTLPEKWSEQHSWPSNLVDTLQSPAAMRAGQNGFNTPVLSHSEDWRCPQCLQLTCQAVVAGFQRLQIWYLCPLHRQPTCIRPKTCT